MRVCVAEPSVGGLCLSLSRWQNLRQGGQRAATAAKHSQGGSVKVFLRFSRPERAGQAGRARRPPGMAGLGRAGRAAQAFKVAKLPFLRFSRLENLKMKILRRGGKGTDRG